MILTGNIVRREQCGFGTLEISGGKIVRADITAPERSDADWILPGFIDVHLHGIYHGNANANPVHVMAEEAPQSGLTTFCPALAADSPEEMLKFASAVRGLVENPKKGNTKIAGSHLEGPFIEYQHRGGMYPEFVRMPDPAETARLLDAAGGTLKIMTLSPELPGADAVIEMLIDHGVIVSAGHTGLAPEKLGDFAAKGGRAVCHLFDAFDGRLVEDGVSQPSLADAALVEDRLFIEIITDGCHVPETLLKLAIRAAGIDRVMGITDSMMGSGLPDAVYPDGDSGHGFILKNGDVCRSLDDPEIIVGSCLTQNRAFYNLTCRFGFTPVQAARLLASTPAVYLGIADRTGELKTGLAADIAVLAPDKLTVKQTIIEGIIAYEQH